MAELLSVLTSVWERPDILVGTVERLLPAWMPWIRKRFKLSRRSRNNCSRSVRGRWTDDWRQEEPTEAGFTGAPSRAICSSTHPVKTTAGREVTRLHGSRFGLAFREFGRRRVGYSLNITDMQTTWTETRRCWGRANRCAASPG